MDRARYAVITALVMVSAGATLATAGSPPPPGLAAMVAAAPTWPASTLLISEVMTGGASASDEFVELYNAGPATIDLGGLEVAYVTSTGSTITRKATWATSQPLGPGQHLLIANTAGIFALCRRHDLRGRVRSHRRSAGAASGGRGAGRRDRLG